jgi:inner membrane protein
MASVISHAIVPVTLTLALGRKQVPAHLVWGTIVLSMLPDLDVIGFLFGVPYESPWGHRGFTHSLAFALLISFLFSFIKVPDIKRSTVFFLAFASSASHGVLDAMTNGGLGIAFFWPLSNDRYFFPWQVIEVSPLGISRFFTNRGLEVLNSEILYVWIPCLALGLTFLAWRRVRTIR